MKIVILQLPVVNLAFFMIGCDTGNVEPPASNNGDNYPQRREVSDVVEFIEKAFENKDALRYSEAISDNFSYVPDSQTETDYPDANWGEWDNGAEISSAMMFFNAVTAVELNLREVDISTESPSGGTANWEVIYSAVVRDIVGSTTNYRARAELDFRLVGSFWQLEKWTDLQGENDPSNGNLLPTMGIIRGAFSSN